MENTVQDATAPDNFLSWFPSVVSNKTATPPPTTPITTVGAPGMAGSLVGDFTAMISGVHEHGCGFEAQNEAWYRFLIQPDPFDSITKDSTGKFASLSGFDDTILKQRADFLRPDSLVAVIVVTDENEEVADPLAIGGQGWLYENQTFPGGPGSAPEGTIECKQPVDPMNPTTTGPYGPNCTSCGFSNVKSDPAFATRCPNDGASGTGGFLDPSDDQINVRFFHQKERFGVFAGYPITRYVLGLTSPAVPDINHEHDTNGNYIGDQPTQANCVNPLYAQNLPTSSQGQELCKLTAGPRTPDLVYYAAIAGVPHELLQAQLGTDDCPMGKVASGADCPQKSKLTSDDWLKITGADPEHYDFTGADYHMIESEDERTTNTGNWANVSTCPSNGNMTSGDQANCDSINGREWATNKLDLQLACRFDIRPQYGGMGKDCTSGNFKGACDCAAGNIILNKVLCDTAVPTLQIYGKAYPSVREMAIAHAMSQVNAQAGGQGIVSSLCPIHVTEQSPGDPVYGYRPAVNAIVDRLKTALSAQCVPQKLVPDPSCGNFPCLVLVSMTKDADANNKNLCKNPGAACDPGAGLLGATGDDVKVVEKFCDAQEAEWKRPAQPVGPEPYTVPVCIMKQLYQAPPGGAAPGCPMPSQAADFGGGSCAGSTDQGWCYVTGAAAGACGHSVVFTSQEPPSGATVSLQCIEQSVNAIDAGGG